MRTVKFFLVVSAIALSSCAPKVSTKIYKNYQPLDFRDEVSIVEIDHKFTSNNYKEVGDVEVRDGGFTTHCSYNEVVEKAKVEARKAGGNVVRITDHRVPDGRSTCHRIKALIVKVDNVDSLKNMIETTEVIDSAMLKDGYALLHVYRFPGPGQLVSYDLYLGDSVICRVTNKWKKTLKIKKDGLNTLWARTEAKVEVPIDIEYGKEYYLRCGVSTGLLVGRPRLQIVNAQNGADDFSRIKMSKAKRRDLITLNDNRDIECIIESEDSEKVSIAIIKDGKKVKTFINKSNIKSIIRSE